MIKEVEIHIEEREVMSIGSVSIDVKKHERDFYNLNLSDPHVVKWLIMYRDKVDSHFDSYIDNFYDNAGLVKPFNQELVHTYVYLDTLIEECCFGEKQSKIIHYLSMGYTFKDIMEETNESTVQNIKQRFEYICKKVANENNRSWEIWANRNYLEEDWKECSKCKKTLPLKQKFYSQDRRNKDGFHSICKKCRSLRH